MASSSAPPWDRMHETTGQQEGHDPYGLTIGQPRLSPADLAAHDYPQWTSAQVRQDSCLYDIHQVIRNLLSEVRELKAAEVKTLYVITDTPSSEFFKRTREYQETSTLR